MSLQLISPLDAVAPCPEGNAAEHVRFLAGQATLAERVRASSRTEYQWLRRGAYEISWPVVFDGLTRAVERRRGHRACALGVEHLEPDCLDRYQDDVEAVLDDLLRHATIPIRNLEGWIKSRLGRATVDGNRRRRGARGALQRPRTPLWLERGLGDDPWLRALAVDIMTWVGVPTTAGVGLWPYAAWADRRAVATGDGRVTDKDVERDVEDVLAVMRQNAAWYERFIERPLGRKQAPPLPADLSADLTRERPHLALIERHEADDLLLRELAAVAIDVMSARIAGGEDRQSVVVEVIRTVFGSGRPQIDRVPGTDTAGEHRVRILLAHPEKIDRLVAEISAIITEAAGHPVSTTS